MKAGNPRKLARPYQINNITNNESNKKLARLKGLIFVGELSFRSSRIKKTPRQFRGERHILRCNHLLSFGLLPPALVSHQFCAIMRLWAGHFRLTTDRELGLIGPAPCPEG